MAKRIRNLPECGGRKDRSLIRRTSKIALEVLGVAVAATTVLLAVLAYKLSAGPVPVSILNQIIKDEATSALPGGHLDIDDTVLIWSAEDRRLGLRLVNVRLFGEDDRLIANVPQLAFNLAMPPLLRGQLAPTSIEFFGVEAQLRRRPGEGVTLGLTNLPDTEADDGSTARAIAPIIAALQGDTSQVPLLSRLTRFGIRQGTLRIVDEVNQVSFTAPNANLVIFRGQGGLAGTLNTDVMLGESKAHFDLSGSLPSGGNDAIIDAHVTGVVPAALAAMSPSFADYAAVDAPIEARGTLNIDTNGDVHSAELSLKAGEGKINLPAPWSQELKLEKAHGLIKLDGVARHLDISGLEFKAGPHSATFKGGMDYTLGQGLNIAAANVDLTASDIKTEVPGFFEGPVAVEELKLKGNLDFDGRAFDLEALTLNTGEGRVALSGKVAMATRSPVVHIKGTLDTMPLASLRALWPLPVADGARVWMSENLNGGMVTNGKIRVDLEDGVIADAENRIPMPEDAIDVQFDMSGSTVRFMKKMPLIEGASAHCILRGNSFKANIPTGYVTLPGERVLQLTEGQFLDDNISQKGAPGVIDFSIDGKTSDILALLDHEPLNLISKFGLDPTTIGGTAKVKGRVTLPMIKHIKLDDVDVAGKVHAVNVSVPHVHEKLDVTDGTLDIDVTKTGMTSKGPIYLNGVGPITLDWYENFKKNSGKPSSYRLQATMDNAERSAIGIGLTDFIRGPVTFDALLTGAGRSVNKAKVSADLTNAETRLRYAGWVKPKGVSAETSFNLEFLKDEAYRFTNFVLTGKEIDARGNMTIAKGGHLRAAKFTNAKLGPDNDFSFTASPDKTGQLQLNLKAARYDVRGILSDIFSGREDDEATAPAPLPHPRPDDAKAEKDAEAPTATSEAATPEEAAAPETPVEKPALLLTQDVLADATRRTHITANIATAIAHGDTSFSNLTADVTMIDSSLYLMDVRGVDQVGIPFTATTTKPAKQPRQLLVESDDAGMMLRAIDLFGSAIGGSVVAKGTFDDMQAGSPMKGTVKVTKFRIANAPVLAKILSLASFTGIGDTLNGEGIQFDKLDIDYRLTEHRIHIDDGRMTGPAIGLTLKGQVDRKNDKVDVEGTIVPAYSVNSILGNVPVLGPLIVGREGEGIFAFTYRVRGKTDDPGVFVNPLSVVAPGFLRRLFEFGNNMAPEPKAETIAPAVPAAPAAQPEPATTPAPATKK